MVGSASGLVSSLALTLLKDLASGVEPSLENFHHCFDCPEDPTTKAFLTGLTVGLLVWPLIDILQVLEEIRTQAAGPDQLTHCQELLQGSCMSSSGREERLREEVISLREELRRLTLRVDRQGDQISVLEDQSERNSRSQLTLSSISEGETSEVERVEENSTPVPGSLGSYCLVSERGGVLERGVKLPTAGPSERKWPER